MILIFHNVFSASDANSSLEVRGVFSEVSKAFDRVLDKGLLHKLKNSGINGNILDLIEAFLHNRRHRVVLNGQYSNWKFVKTGVLQVSVLEALFSLIDINDLLQGLVSDINDLLQGLISDINDLLQGLISDINDLLQGLISDIKLFDDDSSLFFIVNCTKASASVQRFIKNTRLVISGEDVI